MMVSPSRRFGPSLLVLTSLGCAPSPASSELRSRAAYDMNCSDREDIRTKALGNDVYYAEGCGKRAKYAWVCEGHGPMSPCKWVRVWDSNPPPAASR